MNNFAYNEKSSHARFAAKYGQRARELFPRVNSSRVLFQPDIQKCATTKGQLDTQLNENKAVKEVRIHPSVFLRLGYGK